MAKRLKRKRAEREIHHTLYPLSLLMLFEKKIFTQVGVSPTEIKNDGIVSLCRWANIIIPVGETSTWDKRDTGQNEK